jgi:hypothetical protein
MGAMEGGGGGGSSGAYLAREYIWGPGDAWHPASVDELLVHFGENRQPWCEEAVMREHPSIISRATTTFTQIQYAHVVGYFKENLPRPIRSALQIAERLDDVPGAGHFELFVNTSAGAIDKRGASLAAIQANAMQCVDDRQVKNVLLSKERKDATARLVDFLWHVDYVAEEVYEVAQADCRLVSTVRLNGFIPDPTTAKNDDDVRRILTEGDRGREASRALIDDVVRLTLECPGLYYLLVDIAPMEETGAAGVYHPESYPHVFPRSLHRHVEAKKWNRLREKRRDYVRGVFWGKYFSPEVLERLGGKESFRHRYLEKAKQEVANWRSLVQDTPHGGLFI